MAAKEIPMIKHFLMLTTAACILACGAVVANAQEDTDNPVMQQLEQAQEDQTDEVNPDTSDHGMMRHSMRQCMRGDSTIDRRAMRHGGMRGGFAMRIIFALMDPDGDGTISLEEFQAAHERIFKAMDADKDGTVSMEEMRDFLHGAGKATLPQRSAPKD
jgi:EF hand